MSVKPAVVFVPGAWHPASLYNTTLDRLRAAGYQVTGVDLPSISNDEPIKDNTPDVEAVRAAIMDYLNDQTDVLVLMHSYGGLPGGDAVEGLSKKDRMADGERNGVVHLVYMAAFPLTKGTRLLDALGGSFSGQFEWIKHDESTNHLTASDTANIFYNDLDPETAKSFTDKLKKHSYGAFVSPVRYEAFRDIPSTFVMTSKDNALPPPAQEGMTSQPGAKFTIEKLGTGHTPTESDPDGMVKIVRRAAGETV